MNNEKIKELAEFVKEVKNTRNQFIRKASEDWWMRIGVERVVFENILIMYDQMQERLEAALEASTQDKFPNFQKFKEAVKEFQSNFTQQELDEMFEQLKTPSQDAPRELEALREYKKHFPKSFEKIMEDVQYDLKELKQQTETPSQDAPKEEVKKWVKWMKEDADHNSKTNGSLNLYFDGKATAFNDVLLFLTENELLHPVTDAGKEDFKKAVIDAYSDARSDFDKIPSRVRQLANDYFNTKYPLQSPPPQKEGLREKAEGIAEKHYKKFHSHEGDLSFSFWKKTQEGQSFIAALIEMYQTK